MAIKAERIGEQMDRPNFCYQCIWWQGDADGRYGYCGYSGKKVLANKMASACQGAKAKSQKPAKHTRTDNKNILGGRNLLREGGDVN